MWQPVELNLHTQLCCRQHIGKTPTHLWPLLHFILPTSCYTSSTSTSYLKTKPSFPFTLTSFLCSVLLSSLTYPFLSFGCERCNWHFVLHFNFLSRPICPLSSRPARAAPSNSWLFDVLGEHCSKLRAAERKWHKSKDPSDLSIYQYLLSSFIAEVHTAKASYFHNKINSTSDKRNLFKTLNSLLCPPPPPP